MEVRHRPRERGRLIARSCGLGVVERAQRLPARLRRINRPDSSKPAGQRDRVLGGTQTCWRSVDPNPQLGNINAAQSALATCPSILVARLPDTSEE